MTNVITGASAVIFDLEGVVVDTESTWDEAQGVLLARRGHSYDRNALKHRLTGLGGDQAILILIDHYQLPDDPSELLNESREIMIELLDRKIHYVPGALEFVHAAAAAVDVCVATSMDPSLFNAVLAGSDLGAVFPGPIFTPSVGVAAKPAPDLFLHAATALGIDPEDCLVIEDSPTGITAAREAGIPCVGLCTTHERHRLSDANLVFAHWGEVPLPTGLGRDTARSRTSTGTCAKSK
jgi:HAD superfamily hydrolase (TIGR01509 family)